MKKLIVVLLLIFAFTLLFGCITPPICGNGVCEIGEDQNNCSIETDGDCPPINI